MKFNKEPEGILFFTMCHFVFLFQIVFVASIDDDLTYFNKYNVKRKYENPYLLINKLIFYFLVFLTFVSHLRTVITDPGIITSKNNLNIIRFYFYLHESLINRAIAITKKQTQEKLRKIIFEANNIKYDENETYSLDNDEDFIKNNSDTDEKQFEKRTTISEELKKGIIREYRLKLTRCRNCYVARPPNVHHCGICHACILDKDHHCPWVNNCIGLFNKKYFILFNFYAILSVIYSILIFCYFTIFKHLDFLIYNNGYIIFTLIFVILGIIYGSFTFILLMEQYDNIRHDCTLIDYNNGILMEKSTFKQQLIIIFGDKFSFKWFLPFFSGGNYNIYEKICKEEEEKKYKYDKYGNKKEKLD